MEPGSARVQAGTTNRVPVSLKSRFPQVPEKVRTALAMKMIPIPRARADRLAWQSSWITSQCQKTGGPAFRSQKNPALILTVNARTVVLKKKATTQCSVVSLRIALEVTLTSAVAQAVPMIKE
jgi:hypothetical protein